MRFFRVFTMWSLVVIEHTLSATSLERRQNSECSKPEGQKSVIAGNLERHFIPECSQVRRF